ncbi:response regulator [Streptomyces lavendulae]|uniref:response regulator transcription factor n=1 Tax=Streptomyces lavendulae TaxID=1914 RepID=UPI0036817E3E
MAVVDDEPLVRAGLRTTLNSADDMYVVVACAGTEAPATLRDQNLGVVLLDIRMPMIDGLSLLPRITAMPNPSAVAVLTTFDAGECIDAALGAGAAGYLMKNSMPEHLVQSVRTLAAGGQVLGPEATSRVIGGYLVMRVAALSGRERQVLSLLCIGLGNREIAERLHLAHSTAKDHVSAVLAKLGGLNRVQAAVVADRARPSATRMFDW